MTVLASSLVVVLASTPPCQAFGARSCRWNQPVVVAQGASARVLSKHAKLVRFTLESAGAKKEEYADSCPRGVCTCEAEVRFWAFDGSAPGLERINAREQQAASLLRCTIDDALVVRRPTYASTSATLVSTAVFEAATCRGCGGSCRGVTTLTTYDAVTGQALTGADVIVTTDLPALRKALLADYLTRYVQGAAPPGSEAELANVERSVTAQLDRMNFATSGVFVEGDHVFLNVDGFALGCSEGSFHPVELPTAFLRADFLKRLR